MAHAQIIVAVDQPTEVADFDAWLATNASRLTYISDNTGCGCCVDIYDVEGPEEVLRSLPPTLSVSVTSSDGPSHHGPDAG